MPPSINDVTIDPQTVKTRQQIKISVSADLQVTFNTLDDMTWDTIESRDLTWNDVDESV